ncbi:hypothetical protein NCAS_0B03870 [Naumovozyma castellii]|uniref:Carbohydrate kinase FGGY C-terminal domain-containing protein n=1 Tax=Naumovozyma castellii TaxID=27288 RepID=G0V9Y6_NAUCA|nr:hypothetical protein NCAS_0B03870 [Naumovozyma castellii CBS 4309]CCC68471.1 hypothetical protein NCAS_0B03870 [Naumovozyma castellii CBS 4309]
MSVFTEKKNTDEQTGYYVGIDVGTGSVRACVVDSCGNMLSLVEKSINREELKPNFITQSTREIWQACCFCVKTAIEQCKVDKSLVLGIGFDATCSLVAIEKGTDKQVGVGPNFENRDMNVILWMDHRAVKEANEINATNDKCLKYVGGAMSVEMDIPKIKWLKNNMDPNMFKKCEFFELADYLTFKATGKRTRSFCSVVCKQGFLPNGVEGSSEGWSKEFLSSIGLEDLAGNSYDSLGGALKNDSQDNFQSSGKCLGPLSNEAVIELGLSENCVVGAGIIDAYAGLIGTIAATSEGSHQIKNDSSIGLQNAIGRLASVAGTSTCHLLLSKDPVFVPGVWGPYRDVVADGYWCAEGGQTCTGELLSYVLSIHPAFKELINASGVAKIDKFQYLNNMLDELTIKHKVNSKLQLAKHIFFYGDYRGNRSPYADPMMSAAIIGQSMNHNLENLAVTYLAACEFIAQQTRQIVETIRKAGTHVSYIYMSGGQCRNKLLMKLLSDCTGLPIMLPKYVDAAVVFGAAILGATADASRKSVEIECDFGFMLWETMDRMTPHGTLLEPNDVNHPDRKLLDVKYQIFLDMAETQRKYRQMVDDIDI